MRKLFENGEALSNAAVTIALVILAVAASIVAVAWMGGLALTSMATEQVTLADVVWSEDIANVSVTFRNTGNADLSIRSLKIAGADPKNISPTLDTPYPLNRGSSVTFVVSIAEGFKHKVHYVFIVTTSKGNSFGPYSRIAP